MGGGVKERKKKKIIINITENYWFTITLTLFRLSSLPRQLNGQLNWMVPPVSIRGPLAHQAHDPNRLRATSLLWYAAIILLYLKPLKRVIDIYEHHRKGSSSSFISLVKKHNALTSFTMHTNCFLFFFALVFPDTTLRLTICDPIQQKLHLVYFWENWDFCILEQKI